MTGAALALVAAVAPVVLAVIVATSEAPPVAPAVVLIAAAIWLSALIGYRAIVTIAHRERRQCLLREMTDLREARLDYNDAVRGKFVEQDAILRRIHEISADIIEEGIIDPRMTLDNVRLVKTHSREALNSLEDAVIEARVDIGAHGPSFTIVDARDEIETLVAPFARTGMIISTSGPRHVVRIDPAMFRVMIRSLIRSAIDRDASDVDVSIARDEDRVVCTVSDDGRSCADDGTQAIPSLTQALATATESETRFSRALGRNQFSVLLPCGVEPEGDPKPAAPMDVLGDRAPFHEVEAPAGHVSPKVKPQGLVDFDTPGARDETQSVAARRKSHLLSR